MPLFGGTTGFANNQLRFDVQRLTLYVRRFNTCGQERDGAFGDRSNRLGNDGQSWMEVIRPFEVIEAHDRDITGNLKSNGVQVLHQSHHRSIVPSENRGWWWIQSKKRAKDPPAALSSRNQASCARRPV